jgi:hypothetical protein
MAFLRGFGQFWYDFIIGDDWKIAAAVAITLGLGAVVLVSTHPPAHLFTVILGLALMAAFTIALRVDVQRSGRPGRRR